MKKVLYPILAVIVFLVMQVVGAGIMMGMAFAKNPDLLIELVKLGNREALISYIMMGDSLAWGLIISGILTVGIIALFRLVDWKYVLNVKTLDWKVCLFAIIGAVLLIFYTDVISEFFDLPNEMEGIFLSMSMSVVGALSIGVIGPIVEEFVFREAILGQMLKHGVNKWVAIIASALVFGIIHANPAQIPFATMIGIIFGIIYYKTGNIVITSILHILNNSVAVVMMYSMGEEALNASLTKWLGGAPMAIGICAPLLVVGFNFLRLFWKRHHTERFNNNPIEVTNQIPISNETVL